MNPGSGGGGGHEGDGDGPKRFADWMDDARPLAKGKERVPIRTTGPAKAPRSPAQTRESGTGGGHPPTFRFPDDQQPNRAARGGVSDRQLRALAKGEPAPEEKIDLHGMRTQSVPRLLGKRFESARARGLRTVLIIHGYGKQASQSGGDGESILRARLPDWLTTPPLAQHVLALAPAPREFGGDGATLVLLCKRESHD